MRIQTNIFLWGFFAFVVPLTTLALVATYYSQANYLEDVKKNTQQNLNSLSAEIARRLSADRALTFGLSQAPIIQDFLPILESIDQQTVPVYFKRQIEYVNQFFEGFQTIIPSAFIIRILDSHGNTIIKVSQNQRSQPVYDSLQGVSYVEQELNNASFIKTLRSMPKGDVSSVVLPHNNTQANLVNHFSLLDNVIPLYNQDKWVGALSLTIIGEDIDKILNHAIRPLSGKIFIVEVNPDHKNRHGLILYDDEQKLLFAHTRTNPKYLQNTEFKSLLETITDTEQSVYSSSKMDSTLHFVEFTPYPNQFINWIVALNIPNTLINQPYTKIRTSIWLVAAITLLIGLLLTQIGAKRVTRALSALVSNFKRYAQGDHLQIAITEHCVDEIKDLGNAFNDMTSTLNTAHQERDKAQQMMLQSSKLASIGQMAAGIGHEINNPLNNILSYAKLAVRNIEANANNFDVTKKEALLADLQSLREETLRASEIVKGIMNFARQVPPHFTEFDIVTWLNNSLSLVAQAANEKKLDIIANLNLPESSTIKGDRGQLQQVLINLLLNAIQASKPNEKITISAQLLPFQLEITISDNGSGIDEENLSRIFDPFFTTKQQTQGTGLGLSISLGIIQDHQGQLDIRNKKDNHGVIATIKLPLIITDAIES